VILDRVARGHGIVWTRIDSLASYNSALALVETAASASGLPTAVFELFTYSGQLMTPGPAALAAAQQHFLAIDRWAAAFGAGTPAAWRGALEDALRSGHGRAHLYVPGIAESKKEPFKKALREELRVLGSTYTKGTSPCTKAQFIDDIIGLRSRMRAQFGSLFSS
jgi:hypothetical protein